MNSLNGDEFFECDVFNDGKIDACGKEWLVTFNASKTTQLIVSHRKDGEHPIFPSKEQIFPLLVQ
jgi:hypothetical protein